MQAELRLNPHEARALGVLIEKELTTPEQYPLSLNAIVLGCNQKSNRDPQTDFSEAEVVVGLQGLVAKHLAGRVMPAGSRVEKFRHNSRETLGIGEGESAVLAELLMRGPQQPGELRTRASRMSAMPGLPDLTTLLDQLAAKGFARNLGRRAGERAERWGQTLAPDTHPLEEAPAAAPRSAAPASPAILAASGPGSLEARVQALEQRVAALERTLRELGG